MNAAVADNTYAVTPQFITSNNGHLFSLYYTPSHQNQQHPKTTILFFPPFAEELNKSRRMISMQARRFCAAGYAVLLIDLYGTGDSEGDFSEANWDIWLQNMCCAVAWLQDRGHDRFVFWSLRMGAFLAIQTATKMDLTIDKYCFWQPAPLGEMLMTQFLRLRMAADFISGNNKITPTDLRQQLSQGQNVEIAGYTVSPTLVRSIDALDLRDLKPVAGSKVLWLDVIPTKIPKPSSFINELTTQWRLENIDTKIIQVVGNTFWNSLEIIELTELLESTTRQLEQF